MATNADSPFDLLWKEYGVLFKGLDEMTLARWMCQTLGQLAGKAWRQSHPLVMTYRLASQAAHERQIWLMRLLPTPAPYRESPCCRAPALPLLTRDVREAGLVCQHCLETLAPFDEIPETLQAELDEWAEKYSPVHAVAHWDDRQRKTSGDYDHAYESAAEEAEQLLGHAGRSLAVKLLENYPAVIWEDQDECLEVRPEDVVL